jgi:hypothetical protein
MTTDLVRLRVRAGLAPRLAEDPRKRVKPSRRQVFAHTHIDEDGRIARGIAVEALDGQPVVTVVSGHGGDDAEVQTWASLCEIPGAPGMDPVIPAPVDLSQLGRFVVRRCGGRRATLVAFDIPGTVGSLTADVRQPKSGSGLSLALAGCGWLHGGTAKWMDSYFYPRLRLDPRGDDGGSFARWIPARKRQKSKLPAGGAVVDLKVLGRALGCDVESLATLAGSLGVRVPDRANPLDQLLAEVLVLVDCHRVLVAELGEVAPGLPPSDCWSAGSISTHVLRQAGFRSPAETTASVPPEAVGGAAASFHGGQSAALLLRFAEMMSLADLNWTYPTMFSLLALTPHLARIISR